MISAFDVPPGRVVLLNGTSSSGKSTIAAELLRLLPTPWFHLAADGIGAMRAVKQTWELPADRQAEVLRRTRAGFHRAIAAMALAGNDVVADHVLSERWRLTDLLEVLTGIEVFFVAVDADPDELARREQARGDRRAGLAASQLAVVHAHGDYDLRVDTGRWSPTACAELIMAAMAEPVRPTAFDRLRSRAPGGS